jgi:hypothetical protein
MRLDKLHCKLRILTFVGLRMRLQPACRLWVKLRRTHCEQMSSGLSLKADIAQYSRHVSKVPETDMPRFTSLGVATRRPATAIGGGCQLLLAMDYVLAQSSAYLSLPAPVTAAVVIKRFKASGEAAFQPKLPCDPVYQSRSAMPPSARPDAGSSTRRVAARPSGRTASRCRRSPRW